VGEPEDSNFIEGLVNAEPDGAICANDQTAAVLTRSLERKGLRVPRNVRVVGFDDVRFATLVSVPLTTVHQPCREIAVTAFRAMLDRIADPSLPPRSLVLTARLVIRESCGAYLSEPASDAGRRAHPR
jgi:LacI family transcriptional regulator